MAFDLHPIGRDPTASPRTRRLESLVQMNSNLVVARMDATDIAVAAAIAGVVSDVADAEAILAKTPVWTKYTVTYADLAIGATSNTITIATLPPMTNVLMLVAKHTQAFTGGALVDYAIAAGVDGSANLFFTSMDVFSAPSNSAFFPAFGTHYSALAMPFITFAGSHIQITGGTMGVNLSEATQGSLSLWILSSLLP